MPVKEKQSIENKMYDIIILAIVRVIQIEIYPNAHIGV